MKTHYGRKESFQEYGYDEGDTKTLCGIEYLEGDMSENEEYVSCKNCLKIINKNNRIVRNGVASAYLRGEVFEPKVEPYII